MPVKMLRKPKWIKSTIQNTPDAKRIRHLLKDHSLHTVCEESNCPNRGECYNRGTCTFLIMGSICTRGCRFCDVQSGKPSLLDNDEPKKIAESIKILGIHYAVITSVDRDDLEDCGAAHFAETIHVSKSLNPGLMIEVLTPDFCGDNSAIKKVLDAKPEVFSHNIETVRRLTPLIRDKRANYDISLKVLKNSREIDESIPTKSGLMVGLGESDEEVLEALKDLRKVGVKGLTIGQYLPPTMNHAELKRYVDPDTFQFYKREASILGFTHIASGPMVRSSYRADEMFVNSK